MYLCSIWETFGVAINKGLPLKPVSINQHKDSDWVACGLGLPDSKCAPKFILFLKKEVKKEKGK